MKFSDIVTIIAAHIDAGDTQTVPFILGSPGLGKSAIRNELCKRFQFDHSSDLNFSLLDTPDVGGLALIGDTTSDVLKFKKSPLLAPYQEGFNLMFVDEVSDAPMAMQNQFRRVAWTREINGLKLSDRTFIVGAGNRTKDKSGAGRVSGKVKNATSQFTLEANLHDWVEWAQTPEANIDPILIQYLRFQPEVLDMYDPDAEMSPTPRQWELVSRVPSSLPQSLFYEDVASKVGTGPAAAYSSFRALYAHLVSFEDVVMNPKGCPVPEKMDALFATVGSLGEHTTVGNVDRVAEYVDRLPSDMGTLYWMDARKKTPAVKATKAFIKWATANANVVLG